EVADVAEGRQAAGEARAFGLLGVALVLEAAAAREVDRPLLARPELLTVGPDDVDRPRPRPADRAGVGEPLLARDGRAPVALGAGVVLVEDRPPPLDHLLFDRHGTG